MDSVRYEDTIRFCERLGLFVGRTVQLPNEAIFKAALGSVNAPGGYLTVMEFRK